MDDRISLSRKNSPSQPPDSVAEKLLAEILAQLANLQDPLIQITTVFPGKTEIQQMELEKFYNIAEKIKTLHTVAEKLPHFIVLWQQRLIQQLRECLQETKDKKERCELILKLGYLDSRETLEILEACSAEGDSFVRYVTAIALGHTGNPAAMSLLLKLLEEDEDASVRKAAAYGLGLLGDTQAVPSLQARLSREPDKQVQLVIRGALEKLGAPVWHVYSINLAGLEEQLQKCDGRWLAKVLVPIIRSQGNSEVIAKLIEIMQMPDTGEPDWKVLRVASILTLGELKENAALAPLLHLLSDEEEEIRAASAEALGQIGAPQAVQPLIQCLGDRSGAVRAAAARALGRLGDTGAIQPLLAYLDDRDEEVKQAAAWALDCLGYKK